MIQKFYYPKDIYYDIKITASSPSDFDYNSASFGQNVSYLEHRSYTDQYGRYCVATIGKPTSCNIGFIDAGVSLIEIPATITDISGLHIQHNVGDCVVLYYGTQSGFLTAVGPNSIYSNDPTYNNTVHCSAGNVSLKYNFTTNSWEQV